jgi:hypothetical protein
VHPFERRLIEERPNSLEFLGSQLGISVRFRTMEDPLSFEHEMWYCYRVTGEAEKIVSRDQLMARLLAYFAQNIPVIPDAALSCLAPR